MRITRGQLRGLIAETLQEMSMDGDEYQPSPEAGSPAAAAQRIMEISREIAALNREALNLVQDWGEGPDYAQAKHYWYGSISIALGGDPEYTLKSMKSMRDTAKKLMSSEEY